MASEDAAEQRIGAHLAEIFPSDRQLAPLLTLARRDDERARLQAMRSLGLQLRTAAWEMAMVALLDEDRVELRGAAIESLSTRETQTACAALRRRLGRETDAGLRLRLADAIGKNKPC
jgi:HEAT repeat protein